MKLKRKHDGKVFDCTVIEGQACKSWDNDNRTALFVVYYDDIAKWTKESIDNFVPAVLGVDY